MRNVRSLTGVAVLLVILFAGAANGTIVVLNDLNSEARFDTQSKKGLFSWVLGEPCGCNVEHGNRQWFWYRVGDSGPETAINLLDQTGITITDGNFNPGDDDFTVNYADTGGDFTIDLRFTLSGSTLGSGQSTLVETITITNTTEDDLDFHFFQYVDLDLNHEPTTDTVTMLADNKVLQTDGITTVVETVITPASDHRSVALDPDLLVLLEDGSATTLNDATGPISGDVTWAFQWDFLIEPGGTAQISKIKSMIPEPATLVLLGAAGLPALMRRRRRRQGS